MTEHDLMLSICASMECYKNLNQTCYQNQIKS